MAGPFPGERGRQIGHLLREGSKFAIKTGIKTALVVKAVAGGVEAQQPLSQAINGGSDRPGISANLPSHSINTLGRPDDGGKNFNTAKNKGKTSGISPSTVTSSNPPATIEGKYTGDHSQFDSGSSQVVFKNTRGSRDIGPNSRNIAEYNATAGRDWSAPSTGKNLDRPKAPPKFETPVPYDGSPDLLKGIEDTGLHMLEAFLYGGPILAACNPIPVILAQGRETKTPATGPTPTLSPVSEFSEQPLAGELVAKLAGRVTDSGYASESDYSFIDKFMRSKGVTLAGIVGSREVQNYTVVMPVSRDLLDTWKQGSAEPLTYIQNTKTGEKYDLIPAGKIGANIVVYRMIKIAPESMIVRFQNPDGTFSLPARILKGDGSIDPVLGKAQGDRIWFGGLGAFYDGSLLPANAPDTTDYLKQHASAIAKFALGRYEQASDAKLLFDKKFNLNLLPYLAPDGNIHLLIKEETESGPEYDVLNSSGGFTRLQSPPSDMRVRQDDSGRFVYERQGSSADSPWYTIAYFDPDANSGSGAMVNIPATPTPSPTPTLAPTPTETPRLRMPELKVEGARFVEGDKKVELRGAVSNHANYNTNLNTYKRDIDWLADNRANFVVLQWNSGYNDTPGYIEKLVTMAEYAKSKGLKVELSLNGRGREPGKDPNPIVIVNDLIINDWDPLFADQSIAKRFANSVDIFSPLAEPVNNSGGSKIDWNEWKGIAQRAILHIREKIGKPDAIGAISGVFWASDIRDAINSPPDLANVGVEWHPYDGTMGSRGTGFTTQANAMIQKKNVLFFVGEMGFYDKGPAAEDKYKFLTANGISFAVYAINSSSPNPDQIYSSGGVTESGRLAVKYWNSPK